MEGERVLLKENPLSLQTSLTPENFPHVPPLTKRKFVSLFKSGGVMGEVFCLSGRCGLVVECGFAHVLWVGCVGRAYAFHKCRLIPPHQSLPRQLPPEGKPSVRCANMANSGENRANKNANRTNKKFEKSVGNYKSRQACNFLLTELVMESERNSEKASPWGEAGAAGD